MSKEEEINEFFVAGIKVADHIANSNGKDISAKTMRALISDLLPQPKELQEGIKSIVVRKDFLQLAKLAGSGAGIAERDALLESLKIIYSSTIISCTRDLINGLLQAESGKVGHSDSNAQKHTANTKEKLAKKDDYPISNPPNGTDGSEFREPHTCFVAVSILHYGCRLSFFNNGEPVLIGRRDFSDEDDCWDSLDQAFHDILAWSHRLTCKSFPESELQKCVIALPPEYCLLDRHRAEEAAKACGFENASARHSTTSVASLYFPALDGEQVAKCLVVDVSERRISAHVSQLGDGVDETLGLYSEQITIEQVEKIGSSYIAPLFARLIEFFENSSGINLSAEVDYCLLTGSPDDEMETFMRSQVSKLVNISPSGILCLPDAIPLGNALVSGTLSGQKKNILFLDTYPNSLHAQFLTTTPNSISVKHSDLCETSVQLHSDGNMFTEELVKIIPPGEFYPTRKIEVFNFMVDKSTVLFVSIQELINYNGIQSERYFIDTIRVDIHIDNSRLDHYGRMPFSLTLDVVIDAACSSTFEWSVDNDNIHNVFVSKISSNELEKTAHVNSLYTLNNFSPGKCDSLLLDATINMVITPSEALQGTVRTILINDSEKLDVTIPKGVYSGSKLRLKGKGNFQPSTGLRGDLYINIVINDDV